MSDNVKHSKPISIPVHSHSRTRSASLSGSSSSDDGDNSPPLQTPVSPNPPPRVNTNAPPVSPSTSPILSYFFASPPKSAGVPTTPTALGSFGRSFAAAKAPETVMEEDDEHEPALVRHVRRLSTSGWPPGPRLSTGTAAAASSEQHERGAGLLRRLSLGSALVRPQVPNQPPAPPPQPASATPLRSASPSGRKQPPPPGRRTRRSATLGAAGDARIRRAPSPMGERILKGHFDGFN